MDISAMGSMNPMMMGGMMPPRPNAGEMSSKIMEQSDSDGDSLLSIEEIGLSEESFASIDTDGDGTLSSSELQSSISSKLDSVKNGDLTKDDFKSFMSELGLEPPSKDEMMQGMQGGGMPPPPPPSSGDMASMAMENSDSDGDGSLSSSEVGSSETFDELDTNQDGVVSTEELLAGIEAQRESMESGESSKEDFESFMSDIGLEKPEHAEGMPPPPPQENSEEETLSDLVSTLMDALNSEKTDSEDLSLSQFKSIMKMFNNETQTPQVANQLNAYVSNLDINLQTA